MTARARARIELTAEIKAAARRQVAESGAATLSLRAVARELGMASSAVYRYFDSRDRLLTALIVDAFDAIGAAGEEAAASMPEDDLVGRFLAICHAVRDWATEHPHEYALVYGTPVPGYVAPADTADPAQRITGVLLDVLADAAASGRLLDVPSTVAMSDQLRVDLAAISEIAGQELPEAALLNGMGAWLQLFGMVSFELFGHLHNVVEDHDAFFEAQCLAMVERIGLVS